MKNLSKILSVFLALLMVFSIIPMSSIEASAGKPLVWPVPGYKTIGKDYEGHTGIDIGVSGATIVAAMGGTVKKIYRCEKQHKNGPEDCNGFGTGMIIYGEDKRWYQYAHMKANSIPSNISEGTYVAAGTEIGKVGSTGWASGPHLHFEINTKGFWTGAVDERKEIYVDEPYNTLSIKYDANGGTITDADSKYYLDSSDVIYKTSTGKVFKQELYDGITCDSGLYNRSTFGITREGYTFVGWGTTSSGETIYNQNDPMDAKTLCPTIGDSDQTIKLYAIWKPNVLSVYYNANGGKVTLEDYTLNSGLIYKNNEKFVQTWKYNVAKDTGLLNPKSFGLEKKGYTFKGWGTKSTGGTIFDQNDVTLLPTDIKAGIAEGNCSRTLYAIWEAKTYTVTYDSNGGTGTVANSSHTYDTAKALSANKFTRTGYTFLGWSTDPAATTAQYTDKQSVKNLTSKNGGTVTLYAVWSKSGHVPGEWLIATPATCTTEGFAILPCTACGEIIAEQELPMTEHTASGWKVVTAATCTTDGVQQKVCTACSEIVAEEEILATGHIANEWEVTTEATCTTEGFKQLKCTVCKEIMDTEEIPVNDHFLGEWITMIEPTCEIAGVKVQYCVDCGVGLVEEEIPATGHDYENGICVGCGMITPDFTGVYDEYFYKNGVKLKAYQLVEFEGNYYFINDGNRIAKNIRIYLSQRFVEGTPLSVGYYDFDAEGKLVLKNGPDGDYFYRDGIRLKSYQLVEFEGDYYFINDGNKIARNTRIYLSQRFVEGTPLAVGYYEFGADGKMAPMNGPIGDYFYRDGVQLKAYQLVEFEGNFYFVNDSHKLAKNKRIYLSERFTNGFTYSDGTPITPGYYDFDENGKMVFNGPIGDYFYKDGAILKAYQLVEYKGDYYFVNDSNKLAKNKRIYLSQRFVEGTTLAVGYYEFGADGKMVALNGPVGDYCYKDGAMLKAYQLVEFEGNYYFINDSNKLAKNKTIYLSQRFVEGTDLAVGYYDFDANGKLIKK